MKNIPKSILRIGLLAPLTVILTAAPPAGSTMQENRPPSSPFTLAVGEEAAVGSTEVRFVQVAADSRCPRGVNCVWEGDAVVELTVRKGGNVTPLELHTHGSPERPNVGEAQGYRFRLVALEPYPVEGQTIPAEDYRATLSAEAVEEEGGEGEGS
jgi:hypothetical protein